MRGHRDFAEELRVGEISWDLAPAPWSSSALVLARVVELLQTIDDALILDIVEQLALAVVQGDEESEALRAVQSAALENLHRSCQENKRLRPASRRSPVSEAADGCQFSGGGAPSATLAARPCVPWPEAPVRPVASAQLPAEVNPELPDDDRHLDRMTHGGTKT